jgi:hypothetical protein
VRVDPEFAALVPPLSPEQRRQLEDSLLAEGCREPLLVWREELLLLDGHERFALCRQHKLPFQVEFLSLPSRAAALAYLVWKHLQNALTPEAVSYLRGKRYLAEKLPHGGNRREDDLSVHNEHFSTARRLGQEYKVAPATIRRDAQFAAAVDGIVANCGTVAKQLILARDSGLTRRQVLALSRRRPAQQRLYLEALRAGQRPRLERLAAGPATITLPRKPDAFVATLVERLDSNEVRVIARLLHAHLVKKPDKARAGA